MLDKGRRFAALFSENCARPAIKQDYQGYSFAPAGNAPAGNDVSKRADVI